jgi:hypothetical protein
MRAKRRLDEAQEVQFPTFASGSPSKVFGDFAIVRPPGHVVGGRGSCCPRGEGGSVWVYVARASFGLPTADFEGAEMGHVHSADVRPLSDLRFVSSSKSTPAPVVPNAGGGTLGWNTSYISSDEGSARTSPAMEVGCKARNIHPMMPHQLWPPRVLGSVWQLLVKYLPRCKGCFDSTDGRGEGVH